MGEFVGKAALLAVVGALTALKIIAIRAELIPWEQRGSIDNLGMGAHFVQLAFLFLVLGTTPSRLRRNGRLRVGNRGYQHSWERFGRCL